MKVAEERRFKDYMASVQSHVLTALAALVGRGDGVEQQRAKSLAVGVLQRRSKQDAPVWVSAVIALGEMLRPQDDKELAALARRIKRPPDSLVPKFGMIAFGRIGGEFAFEQLRLAYR